MGTDLALVIFYYVVLIVVAVAHSASLGAARLVRFLVLSLGLLLVGFAAVVGVQLDLSSRLFPPSLQLFFLAGLLVIAFGPASMITSWLGRAWGILLVVWLGFTLFGDTSRRIMWVTIVGPLTDLAAGALGTAFRGLLTVPAERDRTSLEDNHRAAAGLTFILCVAAAIAVLTDHYFGIPPQLMIWAYVTVACSAAVTWRGFVRGAELLSEESAHPSRTWLGVLFVLFISGLTSSLFPLLLMAGGRFAAF